MGEVELIGVNIIQDGRCTTKDHIVDYVFKNNFPSYEDLVQAVQEMAGYRSVEKGTEEWLECTHELKEVTKDKIVIRFIQPYCG